MKTKIQKWGNSNGIRIPSNMLKSLNLKTNDEVILNQGNDKIIITIPKKEKISIEERFKNYNGEKLNKDFEWDDYKGEIVC